MPSGPNPTTSTTGGLPAPIYRKKAPVSIFNNSKKKPVKRPATTLGKAPAGRPAPNGTHAPQAARPDLNGANATSVPAPEAKNYQDYPIFVERSTLMRGLHHHALKFQSKSNGTGGFEVVDPYNESQFTRPIRLHRRHARDKLQEVEQSDAASGVDDKERELMSAKRAERQAEREANQALIAPTGETQKKPTKKKPQKKVEDVYMDENNPKHRARAQLRYEEARPWHLEDFDSKNKWIGSYEQPLSYGSVMFEVQEGGFKMIPVEKWYKMTRTDRVDVMDSEQVEKHMAQKFTAPRWFLGTQEAADHARKQAYMMKKEQQLQAQRRRKEDDEDEAPALVKNEEYRADIDEIDFEFNDEFQDDDEGFIYGDAFDDETKEIEKKIRDEMRSANLGGTGVKDEDKDWDEEEQQEKRAEDEERQKQKKARKLLKKKELRHEYESDSEDRKYEDSSDSEENSDQEREKTEEERKVEEARKAGQANGDKSGASTKGANTPTGRPEKKSVPGASLKRDADLSELSGNESRSKKPKLNGRATPLNSALSRKSYVTQNFTLPLLITDPFPADAAKRMSSGYGSGSDTDTTRVGRAQSKLRNSPPGSPTERTPAISRTGTPTGSRAQSPQRAPPFPTLDEVKAAIPREGIAIGKLVALFRTRSAGRNQDFIQLVKQAGKQDLATKKIVPKD